jgi:hypothetical protein
MIGRADIEGSKSNVAMNAWLPQASYPCGNFSVTSSWTFFISKGSIGHAFAVCICTENQNQASFSPFSQHEISVLIELTLGHLRYLLTDVPPQPNSPPNNVFHLHLLTHFTCNAIAGITVLYGISKMTMGVEVFHGWRVSLIFYTSQVISQSQTRVKLNRVFFPRWHFQARSLGCGFAR